MDKGIEEYGLIRFEAEQFEGKTGTAWKWRLTRFYNYQRFFKLAQLW